MDLSYPYLLLRREQWAASADQGFLYHYTKYIQRNVTQILSRKIVNYGPNGVERVWKIQSPNDSPFWKYSNNKSRNYNNFNFVPSECGFMTGQSGGAGWPGCLPPYSDLAHLDRKPWKEEPPNINISGGGTKEPQSDAELWWHMLQKLREDDGINTSLLLVV
jgi:hypothetical protein